ncbi:MAG: hypothetical protein ABI888_06210 [Chloroflexota bacterium]
MTRTSRYLLSAGAVVAVLALALIAGFELRDRSTTTANPSSSPTPLASGLPILPPPSGSGPTASPSPASGAGIYNDDFGFIVTAPGAAAIFRKESSSAPTGSLQNQGFAVSPDGTQIAYWSVATSSELSQIRIVSASNPQSVGALSTLSPNERGGTIVWANDSSGVAYTIVSGDPATKSTIRTFNTRPGSAGPGQVVIEWTEAGRFLQPIGWDRATNVLSAGVTGEGGFMTNYIVANTATPQANAKSLPVTGRVTMFSVRASTDAKFVVGNDIDSGFSYWPLADFSAKVAPAETKYGQAGALWRPGTHEIGFIGPSNQFWLCNVDRNTPLGCGTTAFSGVPTGASLRMFRADGSAVLLAAGGGGTTPTSFTLVKFTNGPSGGKVSEGERVTFSDVGGLTGAVRFR